jgi:oxalate decarboxylase
MSKKMAGVEMRLIKGGIRELHWHVAAERAVMTAGTARITAVDQHGHAFVDDANTGDLWLFPGGIPHSIQGLGADGCQFLLVFNDGNFNEFDTFLFTEWMHHTPKEVLAKKFQCAEVDFQERTTSRAVYLPVRSAVPRSRKNRKRSMKVRGPVPNTFAFCTSKMQPTKVSAGGSVKIVDRQNFPCY